MNKCEMDRLVDVFLRASGVGGCVGSVGSVEFSESLGMMRGLLCNHHGDELIESDKLGSDGALLYLGRSLTSEERLCLEFLDSFLMRVDVG